MASTVLPNGIIIPEKYSRDWYNDLYHNWQELDNLLGVSPGDGTLTIQKNGTTVGTFSANQATDETINLAVPTKTSDLSNDSGFITADNTKIPLSGTNSLAGSIVPNTDNSYDFGSSTYKLRYIYANTAYVTALNINGVAAGDILTHNADEFVDVTSAQTVGGQKIFSDSLVGVGRDTYHFTLTPYAKNTPPASTSYHYIWFGGNTASQGFTNSWYSGYLEQRIYTDGSVQGRWLIRDTSESTLGIELFVNGSNKQFRPFQNGNTDLGTTNRKWKTLNGISPGALSLPSDTNITIDTTSFAWGSNFIFTPSVNGYLFISINSSTGIKKISLKTGRGEYYFSNQIDTFRFTMPVYKDKLVTILLNSTITETIVPAMRLFPCQGNV